MPGAPVVYSTYQKDKKKWKNNTENEFESQTSFEQSIYISMKYFFSFLFFSLRKIEEQWK